jgi:hypothetical protein
LIPKSGDRSSFIAGPKRAAPVANITSKGDLGFSFNTEKLVMDIKPQSA